MSLDKLDKRVEKNITSISGLKNLLIGVIKNPQDYENDQLLKDSLISQGKLSKYENRELNIFATSINTMKRLSSYPDCDFDALNKLRISALEKFQSKEKKEEKPTYNKQDLMHRIDELEKELNINKGSQLLLLKTIYEMNKAFKSIQNISSAEEIKEHISLLNTKIKKVMSLDTSFLLNNEETNVISYDFRKKD
jgi:hypothetical protein